MADPMPLFGPKQAKVPFRVRYRTSRQIMGQSLRMLRRERDLWIFPIVAALLLAVCMVVPAVLLGPMAFDLAEEWGIAPAWRGLAIGLAVLPLLYPVMLLASLCNAALCFAAHERLEGRDGTLRAAWARALSRLGPLARFNLIAMAVAGVLQVLGVLLEKLRIVPFLGPVVQLMGMYGWAAASFFVIPVLVVEEEKRAVGALRSSVGIARKQWGKAVAGIVTIGLAIAVPMVILMLILMAAAFWVTFTWVTLPPGATLDLTPVWIGAAVFGVLFVLAMALAQACTGLYQTALYRYARTGKVSAPYDKATLVDAWAPYRQA